MTRKILLPLAGDTTDTHCGGCKSHDWSTGATGPTVHRCGALDHELHVEPMAPSFPTMKFAGIRLGVCREAESEAAQMARDARLGAAVRLAVAALQSRQGDAYTVGDCAEEIGYGTNFMPFVEGACVLRAVAEALREEAP